MHTTTTPTVAPLPDSPLLRFLQNPGGHLGRVAHAATSPALRVLLPAAVLPAALLLARATARHRYRRRQTATARLLIVRPPADVDPAGGVVFWRNLLGLLPPAWRRWWYGQPHLALEYQASADGIRIAVWVPGSVPPGLVEHAVTAAWPGASVTRRPVTAPLPPHATGVHGGALRLAAPEWFPLHTAHQVDPLRPLLEAAGHLGHTETLRVQILARPATGRRLRPLRHAARHLRTGPPGPLPGFAGPALREVLDLLLPTPQPHPGMAHPRAAADPMLLDDLRLVRDKATQPQWETTVRYAVATTDTTPTDHRRRLRGVCDEVASAFAEYTGRNRYDRRRLRHPTRVLSGRTLRRGDLLSVTELAALAHLPHAQDVPGLDRAGARAVPPRPRVPATGKVLGDTDAGVPRPVALSIPDSRHHVQVIGATGSGKSTLLAHMILDDVTARRGVLVIDPKGDLVVDLLTRLPTDTAERVVLFDPDDHRPHPALNVLAGPDRDVATDNLVGIFRRVYSAYWGPRTDDILRAACLTLTAVPGATLADIPDLLVDDTHRRRITTRVTDRTLRGFWTWYEDLSEPARAHAVAPLLNKLRALLLRPFVATTLCSAQSTVNLTDVLDHGGICLVRIPKGTLGPDTAALFGSLVLAKTWETATARARTGQPTRADAALYIDECHNFLNLPHGIHDMLAEARAFHLCLVLAHQNLAQLPPDLREGLSANARNKILFTASPEDARTLARHVSPTLRDTDLTHLAAYQAAARLLVDSQDTPAFTFRTRPLPPPVPGRERLVRNAARAAHGNHTRARNTPARPVSDPRRTSPTPATPGT